MKRLPILGFLLGLALATVLITWQGWQRITDVLNIAGLSVFLLPLYFLLPLSCALLSWWYLFPKPQQSPSPTPQPQNVLSPAPQSDVAFPQNGRPGLSLSAYCTWINFAVNWLLPVAQVGGEIARVRLLLKRRFPSDVAIASVIGDQTLQIISQALYAFTGIVLLGITQWQRSTQNAFTDPSSATQFSSVQLGIVLLSSVMVLSAISLGLYWIQQQGLFKLFSKVGRTLPRSMAKPLAHLSSKEINTQTTAIDQAVLAMYHRRDRLLIAILWRFGFRLLAAGETWLALHFLGQPVGVIDAIILESLGQAIRSAAFLLPGGLGAQEGGLMLIGAALGIPSSLGLSLSLCKRIRELVIGVPGLIALQIEESRSIITSPS